MRGETSSPPLGRAPILWVVIGLLLAIIPIVTTLPIWVPIAFVASGIWRIWLEFSNNSLPGSAIRLVFFVLSLGGVMLSVGGPLSSESGVAYLVMLTALKFLELRTPRDYVLIASLGYFLLLSGFFFAESLASSVYSILVVAVLTAGIVRLTVGEPRANCHWEELRETLWMVIQAAPVAMILFLLFPRIQGLQMQFFQQSKGQTGMSDELRPGLFATLATTREEAFRVEFDDNEQLEISAMYWRGAVLWESYEDGFSWRQGLRTIMTSQITKQPESRKIWQTITLNPNKQNWLFALDHPLSLTGTGIPDLQAGAVAQTKSSMRKRMRYRAFSELGARKEKLPNDLMRRAKELPRVYRVDPNKPEILRISALAAEFAKDTTKPEEIVERALDFFASNGFAYSLDPGDYRQGGMSAFLFERKLGFCEHYAAAFATLMRLAGVPAIVVLGYQGGDVNRLGGFVTVRQSDAHAWTEVFLGEERGWVRIDPTSVVAPDRVAYGMDPYAQIQEADDSNSEDRIRSLVNPGGLLGMFRSLRQGWDAVSYEWDLVLMNYDTEMQSSVYRLVGLEPNSRWVWLVMIGVLAVVLAIMASLMKRPRRGFSGGKVSVLFRQFCQTLEQRGIPREEWEGPVAYGERAAVRLPGAAGLIREVARDFALVKYGRDRAESAHRLKMERALREQVRRLRKELRTPRR